MIFFYRIKHNKIKKLFRSNDAKVLMSNFGYLSALQFASYVFPFITIPYLSRVIGVEGFGKIAFASAVIVWFETITDWGFNYTATRDVAQNNKDKEKVSEIFSNVLWARIILMVISFGVVVVLTLSVQQFKENYQIILVTFLLIPGKIMFPDWLFQAMEKMKYVTILNLVSKLLFTILIFVFIKEKSDFIIQPMLISFGYIVSGLISFYIILFRWRIKIKFPSIKNILKTISKSTDVFINNLMPNLYNSFSIVLLGFYGGEIANGVFNAGVKFTNLAQQFMRIISRTFFPFLSRRIDKHTEYVKINLYIAIFITVLLLLFSSPIIKFFFTVDFYSAINVLQIMSLSILFLAFDNIFGTNYMIINGYEKKLRNITFFSSIIGFMISFPLIKYFSFIGAATTITLTRGILGVWIWTAGHKIKKKLSTQVSIIINDHS